MVIDDLLNNKSPQVPSKTQDLIADLCNLKVAIPSSFPQNAIPVFCSVEFGTIIESLNNKTFEVGISSATIRFQPIGYNINVANRFGSIKILEAVKVSVTKENKKGQETGAKIGLLNSLKSEFSINHQTAESYVNNYSVSYDHHFVKATSNSRWEVRSVNEEQDLLRGDYLGGSAICYITPVGAINLKSLNATLEISPSQIKFLPVGIKKAKSRSSLKHHKLIQALVAKRVREKTRLQKIIGLHDPTITMSLVEIADDAS